jgi:hypothetical protein
VRSYQRAEIDMKTVACTMVTPAILSPVRSRIQITGGKTAGVTRSDQDGISRVSIKRKDACPSGHPGDIGLWPTSASITVLVNGAADPPPNARVCLDAFRLITLVYLKFAPIDNENTESSLVM